MSVTLDSRAPASHEVGTWVDSTNTETARRVESGRRAPAEGGSAVRPRAASTLTGSQAADRRGWSCRHHQHSPYSRWLTVFRLTPHADSASSTAMSLVAARVIAVTGHGRIA